MNILIRHHAHAHAGTDAPSCSSDCCSTAIIEFCIAMFMFRCRLKKKKKRWHNNTLTNSVFTCVLSTWLLGRCIVPRWEIYPLDYSSIIFHAVFRLNQTRFHIFCTFDNHSFLVAVVPMCEASCFWSALLVSRSTRGVSFNAQRPFDQPVITSLFPCLGLYCAYDPFRVPNSRRLSTNIAHSCFHALMLSATAECVALQGSEQKHFWQNGWFFYSATWTD